MLERKDEKALMNPKNRAPLTETDLTPHYDSRAYKVQPGVEPLREQRTSRENFQRQNRTKWRETEAIKKPKKKRAREEEKAASGAARTRHPNARAHQIWKIEVEIELGEEREERNTLIKCNVLFMNVDQGKIQYR